VRVTDVRDDPEPHQPVRVKGEDIDYKRYYSAKWLRLEGWVLWVMLFFMGLGFLGFGS
jgi:hypothetical protein